MLCFPYVMGKANKNSSLISFRHSLGYSTNSLSVGSRRPLIRSRYCQAISQSNCEKRRLASCVSVRPSVRVDGITRLLRDRLPWNVVSQIFTKSVAKKSRFVSYRTNVTCFSQRRLPLWWKCEAGNVAEEIVGGLKTATKTLVCVRYEMEPKKELMIST